MRISTKGRYALRLMLDVATNDSEGYVSLRDAAARQQISVKYLEQIAGILARAGLLQSGRGAQGGYRLTRPSEQYTAGDILRLTEGELAPVDCLKHPGPECLCVRSGECATLTFWSGLYAVVNDYTDRYTLADLLAKQPFRANQK